MNRVIAGVEIWAGNFDPIHRHRPSKNGEAGLQTSFSTTFSKKPIGKKNREIREKLKDPKASISRKNVDFSEKL